MNDDDDLYSNDVELFQTMANETQSSMSSFNYIGVGMLVFFIAFVFVIYKSFTNAMADPMNTNPASFILPFLVLMVIFVAFGIFSVAMLRKRSAKLSTSLIGTMSKAIARENTQYQQFNPMEKRAPVSGNTMFCPECGKQISADSTFCKFCGFNITKL